MFESVKLIFKLLILLILFLYTVTHGGTREMKLPLQILSRMEIYMSEIKMVITRSKGHHEHEVRRAHKVCEVHKLSLELQADSQLLVDYLSRSKYTKSMKP